MNSSGKVIGVSDSGQREESMCVSPGVGEAGGKDQGGWGTRGRGTQSSDPVGWEGCERGLRSKDSGKQQKGFCQRGYPLGCDSISRCCGFSCVGFHSPAGSQVISHNGPLSELISLAVLKSHS